MPGAVEVILLRLVEPRDAELLEQLLEARPVQAVEVRPRQLAFPHPGHGWLVFAPPGVGEGYPVGVDALLAAERTAFLGDAGAPVHDGAEHVEREGLHGVDGRGIPHETSFSTRTGVPASQPLMSATASE
jgi:hypothetical protein